MYSLKFLNIIALTKIGSKWYIDIGKKRVEGCLARRFSEHYSKVIRDNFRKGLNEYKREVK